MGFLGLKSTLIPMDIVRVNEGERTIEVSGSKAHVKTLRASTTTRTSPPTTRTASAATSASNPSEPPLAVATVHTRRRRLRGQGARAARLRSGRRYRRPRSFFRRPRVWGTHLNRPKSGEDPRDTTGFGESPLRDDRPSVAQGPSLMRRAGEAPTTRQTEETETFQEGGRTKIRRRVYARRSSKKTTLAAKAACFAYRGNRYQEVTGVPQLGWPSPSGRCVPEDSVDRVGPRQEGPSPRLSRRAARLAGSGWRHRRDQSFQAIEVW